MSVITILLAASMTTSAWAQTNMSPVAGNAYNSSSSGNMAPSTLPSQPAGYSMPSNNPQVSNPTNAPAAGAIQTPGSINQNGLQDRTSTQQSSTVRPINQNELNFRNNIQGQPPQAISPGGIGVPDPMNPNQNIPTTTPQPLPTNP